MPMDGRLPPTGTATLCRLMYKTGTGVGTINCFISASCFSGEQICFSQKSIAEHAIGHEKNAA